MKNLVLLIDTNVILDYLLMRQPFFEAAARIMFCCQRKNIQGYVAFHSLPNMWYVLRKHSTEERRAFLLNTTNILTVAGASHEAVNEAIQNEDFDDFEDCLQEKCAMTVHTDYIVTRNLEHFPASTIPAVTPTEMLNILYDAQNEL